MLNMKTDSNKGSEPLLTDRQTDRQGNRETARQTDKQTEKKTPAAGIQYPIFK